MVDEFGAFAARSPCTGAPFWKYKQAVQREIGAGIDGEDGRRLAEIAMISADWDNAGIERHTRAEETECPAQPDRTSRYNPPHGSLGLQALLSILNGQVDIHP